MLVNRRQWNEDLKAQAKALYLADGSKLAAEVTCIPLRTVQRWARTEGWDASREDAIEQAPDQRYAVFAPGTDGAAPDGKGNGATAPPVPSGSPSRELARDLLIARQVWRAEADKLQHGRGRPGAYRDAGVVLGILQDKASKAGVADLGAGFSWEANRAQARANVPLLREWLAAIRDRLAQQRGGT